MTPTCVIEVSNRRGSEWEHKTSGGRWRYLHKAMLSLEQAAAPHNIEWHLNKETGNYEGFVV